MPENSCDSVSGHFADDGGVEVPLLEDAHDLVLAAAFRDDEHPLLRFRQHDLVRRHAAFAHGNFVEVETDTCSCTAGHLE